MNFYSNSGKIFWLRISITSIATFLLFAHLFIAEFNIDIISVALILIAIIPWSSSLVESAEFPGGVKVTLRDLDEPTEQVELTNIDEDAIIIKHSEVTDCQLRRVKEPPTLLVLKARINYKFEAGAQYLMRIHVNEEILKKDSLINKPKIKRIQDGREFPWFDEENKSWNVNYSPDFKSNYFHFKYRVINGDPYTYIFDLSNIDLDNDVYKVCIEHNGKKGNEAYWNPLIVKDVDII